MQTKTTLVNKTGRFVTALALSLSAAATAFGPGAVRADNSPTRVSTSQLGSSPHYYSGVIWGNGWRGSGTVARHPKIAVSCAHVVFDNNTWLQGFDWARAWHQSYSPSGSAAKQDLRGYWYWSSYTGGTSSTAFSRDFVVHYAYDNLANGGYGGWWYSTSNTAHPLNKSYYKLIVGYPGSDGYYMNETGPFTSRYTRRTGFYFWNPYVKGGGGMSGGGVFAYSNGYKLAGVHVSGTTDGSLGAGVRALDKSAFNLMTTAINSAEAGPTITNTFYNTQAVTIPDYNSAWTVRNIYVSGMPSRITAANVSLNIGHSYKGDLQVVLTSPAGRNLVLHNRTGGSGDNVVFNNASVLTSFRGTNPNGTWKIQVRDMARADVGTFNWGSLTLSAHN